MTESGPLSKPQLDKLGSRLRNSETPSDEDLVLLNSYREQFTPFSDAIASKLREVSPYSVNPRPQKSIPSIVAKLRRRQPARLSAIQDIAGARITAPDQGAQDEVVARINYAFPNSHVVDKRETAAFGYRAVHVVIVAPILYEVQVRTEIQHAWAQLSEALADRHGFELKYGGGPTNIRLALLEYSEFAAAMEGIGVQVRRGDFDPIAVNATARKWLARLPGIFEKLRTI